MATCLEIDGGNEQSSHAGVKLPPSDIAHVPLMTKNITHGGIIVVGGALGVQVQTVLKMGIPAHGTDDAPITTAVCTDTDIDHAHFRAHPIGVSPQDIIGRVGY